MSPEQFDALPREDQDTWLQSLLDNPLEGNNLVIWSYASAIRGIKSLSRDGVSFSPEQEALIREAIKDQS